MTEKVPQYLATVAVRHFVGQAFQGSPLLCSVQFWDEQNHTLVV